MKTSSLPSRKLLVWETQSTRLFLLFNIIQQSSRYSSQSEAGWWCLKHRFFASPGRWSPGLRKVVPTSSMRSSNPRTHSFLGQERGKFILGPQWDSKIPRNSNLFFFGILESVTQWDSKIPRNSNLFFFGILESVTQWDSKIPRNSNLFFFGILESVTQWDSKIPRNSNLFFCWNIGISDSVGFQDSKRFQPFFLEYWNQWLSGIPRFQVVVFLNHVSTHTIHHVKKI